MVERERHHRQNAVLVCEDDPVQAHATVSVLQAQGWRVIGPAVSAKQAARLAEDETICAALLDVSLDGGSSAEAGSILRARGVPFAFVTSYGPATAATLGQFSEHLVVPKPITAELVEQILDTLLTPHRAAALREAPALSATP
ncbi:response regulator [Parvularcula sp. ZS-1/3]|uniref:Response regulator n=1 Tax=Parvularcula mediterranea TaxID=2732508 RepID=A0A7Y3W5B5_9PROT|nr:response regulator [Parvularcula mediterranea]NNU16434.1 response regulator [Parvularcula mediterranea]